MDKKQDENYSKGVWIAGIVLAVIGIGVDICALAGVFGGNGDFMQQSAWFSLPLACYVLYKCIVGLKKKQEEEKA